MSWRFFAKYKLVKLLLLPEFAFAEQFKTIRFYVSYVFLQFLELLLIPFFAIEEISDFFDAKSAFVIFGLQ
jgi:hypothetical protein